MSKDHGIPKVWFFFFNTRIIPDIAKYPKKRKIGTLTEEHRLCLPFSYYARACTYLNEFLFSLGLVLLLGAYCQGHVL